MKMKKKRLFTDIKIGGMHSTGRSTGFVGGKRIYLDNGIPGETVTAGEVRREADYMRGTVVSCEEASPDRVKPFCKHYDICGGCNWQHIQYPAQLQWKKHLLEKAFQKYGIESPEIPLPVESPRTEYYRHRIEYSFSARRWYHAGEGKIEDPRQRIAAGFHPAGNPDKVLEIKECYLQDQKGLQMLEFVKSFCETNSLSYFDPKESTGFMRTLVIRRTKKGDCMLILIFGEQKNDTIQLLNKQLFNAFAEIKSIWWGISADPAESSQQTPIFCDAGGDATIEEESSGIRMRISPGSFYQPNPLQADAIYEKIRELSAAGSNDYVMDLYCGIGSLSLGLARDAKRVEGIEGSEQAVEDACHNAEINGFGNCRYIQGDVLITFTREFVDEHGKPDIILLDPPRSGTLIEIKKTILYASPKKIIYLSCNPVSLAFDLKMLCQDYKITYIQPFDQFPHTHHLETLVMLEK